MVSYLLGEIQQLLDCPWHYFQQFMAGWGEGSWRSNAEEQKTISWAGTEQGMGTDTSPAKIAVSFLSSLAGDCWNIGLGCGIGPGGSSGTSNSPRWWWAQGYPPWMGLAAALCGSVLVLPSRAHGEGRNGSDGCKGKEVVAPFCFNGKEIALWTHRWMWMVPNRDMWVCGTGVNQDGALFKGGELL